MSIEWFEEAWEFGGGLVLGLVENGFEGDWDEGGFAVKRTRSLMVTVNLRQDFE